MSRLTALAEKKALTAAEEAELNRLWRKLVKVYHPDRFANEPDKLAAYGKLTAAINPERFRGQPREGGGRHPDAARNRGRPGWLHPAAGLDGIRFQRRGGTGGVAAAA